MINSHPQTTTTTIIAIAATTIDQAGVFLSGPGLRRAVTSGEEALRLVARGDAVRAMGATDCNQHSSRSHAILSFHVESQRVSTSTAGAGLSSSSLGRSGGKGAAGGVRLGKLHLVDLAGRCVFAAVVVVSLCLHCYRSP